MKIASSSADMSVQHSATRLRMESTRVRMWVGEDPARTPQRRVAEASDGDAMRRHWPVMQRPQAHGVEKSGSADEEASLSPRYTMLRDLIERMTGMRLRTVHWSPGSHGEGAKAPAPAAGSTASQPATGNAVQQPNWGAEIEHREVLHETESTNWSAQGTIRTADGQEIRFSLQLSMQRSYHEESSTTLRMGNAVQLTDPLVINFNGTAAQLQEGGRFTFDLDADGTADSLAQLASGSGFLALDLNGNGRIDDGRELFGPTLGDGYKELAMHDQDGNGWIDENDAVFEQLRVWVPTEDGGGQLMGLLEAGVGALSLQAAATPFTLKGSQNQTLGAIRQTSVYLREDGGVGSMQQVDLVV